MEKNFKDEKITREFKLTTLALKNKNTIFLLSVILIAFGIYSYRSLPKELFPDIYMPTIMVQTLYPGNPPADMENLVTRPIEKEIETIKGIKEINSLSQQDASIIFVEFTTGTDIDVAEREVKDAVDKAASELPDDLLDDPMVMDIDFSEFPIININLSGDYSINELKAYAEYLEDEMEGIYEVSKVEITGLNEREVEINADPYLMDKFQLSFNDLENAISSENVSISGGELDLGRSRRSIRVIGEFESMDQIRDIIVKHENGNIVYLKDVAEVIYGFEETDSYARLNRNPVVTLQIVKKGGENLLATTDQVFNILEEAKSSNSIPDDLNITITNDQSEMVKKQLSNLENSILMGVIFVILVLFFFLGTRNALFVGIAIPMSMFISFLVMGLTEFQVNMIVLFSMILALGMLVDNAIVVVENIYRFLDRGFSKWDAAKNAVGEIAWPIITSTATTLAAFFPLVFWEGLMGEFMSYLPITLIIVLTSSLFVALVIIPVVSSTFIKTNDQTEKPNFRKSVIVATGMLIFSALFILIGVNLIGSLLLIFGLIGFANILFLDRAARWFQNVFLVKLENIYILVLNFLLKKRNPLYVLLITFLLLVSTIVFYFSSNPKIITFPSTDPEYINILAELPIGTDIDFTDSVMYNVEDEVFEILQPYDEIVKSVLTIVGKGAVGEQEGFDGRSGGPNRGLTTVSFVDYEFRNGINTSDILKQLSDSLVGTYPGVELSVEKQMDGPPTGRPINIEISGKEFDKLISITDTLLLMIEEEKIPGIEGLKVNLDVGKPELIVHIDRERARRFGLSTAQVAMTIRTALFGKEVSDYKVGEDEYPIQLRLKEKYRNNISTLLNQKVTFRSASTGQIIQIPISAVADIEYSTTYGSVNRIDLERVVTIYSNVLEGYNPTEINNQIETLLSDYDFPEGYDYEFTGEQQEQEESMAFLERAMLIAISLILIILVTQFNSVVKPFIIMISVLFSTIGVFGGLATFKMDFIVIMTGIGIISLAGVVVNNAIVLIDYIDLLKNRRRKELGIELDEALSMKDSLECVVEAGKTRLRPVLLTAITTILGLIPLASGLNIDIAGFLTNFNANIYFGGDNVAFWGPISWTIIFGLAFATFLTLLVVPSMYHLLYKAKIGMVQLRERMQKK
ncbi:MAG: efflux RND transporter permease subunit [Bacteroidales bacterium]|nr:efflux RND transporter permease subunit [Bacteroidales bacterium]MCF8386810.1 efflux RND transporter permease subunit [Bacteroidales bacterium]MCF8397055.1 efflux RND transporter permease subunit [Bacteroidales bacterium]